jgi:excisionase family DNA binding protein
MLSEHDSPNNNANQNWSQFKAAYGLDEKSLYSINEARAKLGIGRTSLHKLINTGALPVVKSGRRTLIAAPDLVQFIAERRVVLNKVAA